MLILGRRTGETIRIGDDIEAHILSQDGYQTKVGVTAPQEVPVHRDEVYQRIKDEEAT